MKTIFPIHQVHLRGAIRCTLHRCAATCSLGALAASLLLVSVPDAHAAETYTTVVSWGLQSTVPPGLTGVIDIATGAFHNLALKADGSVVGWGEFTIAAGGIYYNYGQQIVPDGLSGVIGLAGGDYHSLALKSDGTVVAWGLNNHGQCTVPGGLANVTAIAAGGNQSLALKSDGTVVHWGLDDWMAVDPVFVTPPAGMSDVIAIDAGIYHSVALKRDGTVVVWGPAVYADNTAPSLLSGVIAIAAGDNHTLALKSDRTVVAWGYNNYGQCSVPQGLTNVIAIAAGADHSLALKSDGSLVAWGDGYYGQTTIPAGLTGVTAIAAGAYHNAAIITVTVFTPQESITNLIADIQKLVDNGVLTSRQATNLTKPLSSALSSVTDGNEADACKQLSDFIKSLQKNPKPLDAATAVNVIAAAQEIRSSIGCL